MPLACKRAAVFVLLLSACAIVRADDTPPSCASLEAQRDKAAAALDKIQRQKLPEEQIADLNIILGQMIDLLDSNASDSKDVEEKIKKLEDNLPESELPAVKAISQFIKGVSGGLGASRKKQEAAKEFLSGLQDKLQIIQSAYAAGDDPTAKGQIEHFADFFDGMRKTVPGIDEVPGLKDLFQAYSDGIRGIAKSAGTLDQVVARDNQIYRDAGFEGDLYVRAKTPREIRADMINSLSQKLSDIEQKLADNACSQPQAAKQDPCTDSHNRPVADVRALESKLKPLKDKIDEYGSSATTYFIAYFNMSKDDPDRSAVLKSYKNYATQRDALVQQYQNQAGDLLNLARNAEHWTPDEDQRMAECFPYFDSLRQQASLRPKSTPSAGKQPPKTTEKPSKTGSSATKAPAGEGEPAAEPEAPAKALAAVQDEVKVCKCKPSEFPFNVQTIDETVESADPSIATARIRDGRLVITGKKHGETVITVKGDVVRYQTGIPDAPKPGTGGIHGHGPNSVPLNGNYPFENKVRVTVTCDLSGTWSGPAGNVTIIDQCGKVTLAAGKSVYTGTAALGAKGYGKIHLSHSLSLDEVSKDMPDQVRNQVAGHPVVIDGSVADDEDSIQGDFITDKVEWKQTDDGPYQVSFPKKQSMKVVFTRKK